MILVSILIALGLVQLWGSGAPLHRDQWFYGLIGWLQNSPFLSAVPGASLFFALALPLLGLALIYSLVQAILPAVGELLVLVLVLLYSLGRGDYSARLTEYINAWKHGDSAHACNVLAEIQHNESELEAIDDWPQLHQQALTIFAYRGFERLFAVLFWFIFLGAGGALLYRLSALYLARIAADQEQPDQDQTEPQTATAEEVAIARRWLWILEWPAIRLMGFSWALAGNFVGCYQQWRESLLCLKSPSTLVLRHYIKGALGVNIGVVATSEGTGDAVVAGSMGDIGDGIKGLRSLLARTLVVWLSVLALWLLLQ